VWLRTRGGFDWHDHYRIVSSALKLHGNTDFNALHNACRLDVEGIVSKRADSAYQASRYKA
jgi:ATP-dependent DNA ligase